LTLNRVILHIIVHHSSTSIYTPNFIEIEETFYGWTDVCTDEQTFETLLGRLRRDDLKCGTKKLIRWKTQNWPSISWKHCMYLLSPLSHIINKNHIDKNKLKTTEHQLHVSAADSVQPKQHTDSAPTQWKFTSLCENFFGTWHSGTDVRMALRQFLR